MPAYTQLQYDTLQAAIAQGALKVEYGDKKVEYRSLKDMLELLNIMGNDLGLVPARSGRRYATFSKGLCDG